MFYGFICDLAWSLTIGKLQKSVPLLVGDCVFTGMFRGGTTSLLRR